jgi:ketosteroid isomerase-like protein
LSANVDLVRSIYADWERGDFTHADWAGADIEFVMFDGPSPGSWRGLAAAGAAFRDWLSAWDDWDAVAEGYRELDGERVLVLTTGTGRGKASGLGVGQLYAHSANLFHVRDGKVARLVIYFDRERGLADLGLEG